MIEKGLRELLVFDYENALMNKQASVDNYLFKGRSDAVQEEMALFLIQYTIETYLRWTPQMARDNLDYATLKQWKLVSSARKVRFPMELNPNTDYFYIVHLIYPDKVKVDKQDMCLRIYKSVLDPNGSKIKFPKGYFLDISGTIRACACLRYAIENFGHFSSIESMYEFFGTDKCREFMRKYKLATMRATLYETPVQFLDDALPQLQKNRFLYEFYHLFQKIEANKNAEKVKNYRAKKEANNEGTY